MLTQLYTYVIAGLKKTAALSNYLEKTASADALSTKTAHDVVLFSTLKKAAIDPGMLSKLVKSPFGKGLGYAAGAAIPVTAGGAYLMHRAGEESRKTIEDARNKALQTALGLGGIGAGLYGLHRLTAPTEKTITTVNEMPTGQTYKSTSTQKLNSAKETPEELVKKLATTGYLETLLEEQEKTASKSLKEEILNNRLLNCEHGVYILGQLLA